MHLTELCKTMLQIESTKPDNFTPLILEKKDDYLRVEYQSPILGVSINYGAKSRDSLLS